MQNSKLQNRPSYDRGGLTLLAAPNGFGKTLEAYIQCIQTRMNPIHELLPAEKLKKLKVPAASAKVPVKIKYLEDMENAALECLDEEDYKSIPRVITNCQMEGIKTEPYNDIDLLFNITESAALEDPTQSPYYNSILIFDECDIHLKNSLWNTPLVRNFTSAIVQFKRKLQLNMVLTTPMFTDVAKPVRDRITVRIDALGPKNGPIFHYKATEVDTKKVKKYSRNGPDYYDLETGEGMFDTNATVANNTKYGETIKGTIKGV